MFADRAKIYVKAGDGGNGAVTFHREKYIAAGGPDGGDGGNGGDVVFVVSDHSSTLEAFRYRRKYIADSGENGMKNRRTGKSGASLTVSVPRGTLVREEETGRLLADLSSTEPVVIAKGGRGGAGNQHFATSTRQIPRFAKPGKPGEELHLLLELKLLADVGLVGFPNVGKSTLLSDVSAAKPQIANYHFTTLSPILGVVTLSDENSFVMADIPGLIEGASEGVGLGHDFLRHVERCRLILHVVDVSGSEGRDPISDYEIINKELRSFSEELASRPQIVAGNKCDLATPSQIETLKKYVEKAGNVFFPISAATTEGISPLMHELSSKLQTLPPIKRYEAQPITDEERERRTESPYDFHITVEDGVYYVESAYFEGILQTADMEDYASLQYFQKMLVTSGAIDKLEEMGIREGDTVDVSGYQFDYIK